MGSGGPYSPEKNHRKENPYILAAPLGMAFYLLESYQKEVHTMFHPVVRSRPQENYLRLRELIQAVLKHANRDGEEFTQEMKDNLNFICRTAGDLGLVYLTVPELYPMLIRTIEVYPEITKFFTDDEQPTPMFPADFTAGYVIPYIQAIPYT